MKQFLSIKDVADPASLVQQGLALKANPFGYEQLGKHKTLGLLFFNASLRTRLSTQKAAQNLGMEVMVMNMSNEGWQLEFGEQVIMDGTSAEHIKEAAAVVSQYCDIIGIRTFSGLVNRVEDYSEKVLTAFVDNATVPIISLESATLHPLQSLTDWMTIEEHKKVAKPKVVLTWAPHPKALPQAVANSFVQWMQKAPVELVVTHPKGYELAPEFSNGVTVEYNQDKAFERADFIYAKNWSAYNDYGKILSQDTNWTITEEKMGLTNSGAFMHCLPVRRNMVVSDGVLDNGNSLVIKQAENRIYAAQAVLKSILQG
jgi:N-succinyl-L-ornithine transcarbamylase